MKNKKTFGREDNILTVVTWDWASALYTLQLHDRETLLSLNENK